MMVSTASQGHSQSSHGRNTDFSEICASKRNDKFAWIELCDGRFASYPPEANQRGWRRIHQRDESEPSFPSALGPTAAFKAYLKRLRIADHDGHLVCLRGSGAIVGVINFNHIIRRAFQSAFLGYYAVAQYAGQGLMFEGMQLTLRYAFRRLKLHRLEANIQPGNSASIALVKRCGFSREGFSLRYLKIDRQWSDHERWALLAENWKANDAV